MDDPDDPNSLPTQHWTGPADLPAAFTPGKISDSEIEGMLGANSPVTRGGWQPPAPGDLQARLPQYEITELLGRGGMGAVYKGWQRSLDRFVAIKILPPGLESSDVDFAARFKREAKAMAKLKHPGIIPVHEAGETADGLLYFVMDFVDGTDVQKMVAARGRLPPEEALPITARVLEALAYAHQRGIIHRDIKPANIMVDDEGNVLVADFGLARSTAPDSTMLTVSNMAMGTPDFMAPESHLGMDHVDHRADLYAVGVMLYQMLTGKLPRGRFDPPSRAVPGLDKRLDVIVDRTLQNERDARYSSAIELRSALEPVLARTAAKRIAATASAKSSGNKRWLVGGAVFVVLAVGGLLLLKSDGGKSAVASHGGDGLPEAEALKPAGLPSGTVSPSLAPQASGNAPTVPGPSPNGTTRLLPLVQIPRDVVQGTWSRKGEELSLDEAHGFAMCELPCEPPEEYDFEVEFTPMSDGNNVNLHLRAGGAAFMWKLHAYRRTPPVYGFDLFDGNRQVPSLSTVNPLALEIGRRYTTRVEVRRTGLRGFVNGVEFVAWTGDFKHFSTEETARLRDDRKLAIGSHDRSVLFHRADVRAVGAASITPAAATKDAPFVNTLGMKFLPVPITGGPTGGQRVLFSIWETRMQDYEAFATETKREWPKPDFEQGPTHPAVMVSWDEATAFCQWLTERERKAGKLGAKELYRLPSDHEWSCAVGIGEREDATKAPEEKSGKIPNLFPWGTQWPPPSHSGNYSGTETEGKKKAWSAQKVLPGYADPFTYTAPVGSFASSASGLFDLDGNAWEWCATDFDQAGVFRVLRGGSFVDSELEQFQSSHRPPGQKSSRRNNSGFRVVLAPASSAASAAPAPAVLAFGGHRYQVVAEAGLPWPEAKAKAEAMGGHLAVLTSKEEADLVGELCHKSLPGKPGQAWLGGTREKGRDAPWTWINGEPFGYRDWPANHFEDNNQAHYLTFNPGDAGKGEPSSWNNWVQSWDAQRIRDHIGGYVVEWDAPAAAGLTFGGHRYQIVPGNTSWSEAKARAGQMGGHLATITSKEENDWIRRTFVDPLDEGKMFWIGATNAGGDGQWRWVNGEPFAFTGWAADIISGQRFNDKNSSSGFCRNLIQGIGWSLWSPDTSTPRNIGFLVEWDDLAKNP